MSWLETATTAARTPAFFCTSFPSRNSHRMTQGPRHSCPRSGLRDRRGNPELREPKSFMMDKKHHREVTSLRDQAASTSSLCSGRRHHSVSQGCEQTCTLLPREMLPQCPKAACGINILEESLKQRAGNASVRKIYQEVRENGLSASVADAGLRIYSTTAKKERKRRGGKKVKVAGVTYVRKEVF